MGSLKSEAESFEPKTQRNISELDSVEVSNALMTEERTDSSGKTYTVKYIVIDTEEFRVPDSVIAQLKEILEENSNLKTFRVKRTGTSMTTKYQVIPLK